MQFTIVATDAPTAADRDGILTPLVAYNDRHGGPSGFKMLALLLRDQAGRTVGGLWGRSVYDWMYVELLAVPEALRRQGVGSDLMRRAEIVARERGCLGIWLDTYGFQASRLLRQARLRDVRHPRRSSARVGALLFPQALGCSLIRRQAMPMNNANPPLPLGYSPLAPGTIATVVTYLEMTQRPLPRDVPESHALLGLTRFINPDPAAYRHLFRRVGEDWLWESRLLMPDEALLAILRDPCVEVYALRRDGIDIGLLELDFRQADECELAFFGLVREAVGQGAGRFLMEQATAKAWSRSIRRFWVHTCTFDHPAAVDFYRRSGFRAYASAVEVIADPRLSGTHPRTAAPHVPLIAE